MLKKGALLVAYAAAVFFLTPAVANAATSYQGSDYSYDFNSGTQMRTCDVESDNHEVHADYDRRNGSRYQVTDSDGANGVCASSGYNSSKIWQHKTCEEINFWPDDCGNWQGTGY